MAKSARRQAGAEIEISLTVRVPEQSALTSYRADGKARISGEDVAGEFFGRIHQKKDRVGKGQL